tara:strand:+ start:822 stop:1196 length:375 start_codon:yes stop_codon:yes gene_type:complete
MSKINSIIDIRNTKRLTSKRRNAWVEDALKQAKDLEGKRRLRLLERRDVENLVDAVRAHEGPVCKGRAYAQGGAFVANAYRTFCPITACTLDEEGRPLVIILDAKRPHARAAGLTINDRKVGNC